MFDTVSHMANPTALIAILIVALVLFGSSRIPEMMRGLGSGMKEFKKGMRDGDGAEGLPEKETAKTSSEQP